MGRLIMGYHYSKDNTVEYCFTVQYSTVNYSTVQDGIYCTVEYSEQYSTIVNDYSTVFLHSSVGYSTLISKSLHSTEILSADHLRYCTVQGTNYVTYDCSRVQYTCVKYCTVYTSVQYTMFKLQYPSGID